MGSGHQHHGVRDGKTVFLAWGFDGLCMMLMRIYKPIYSHIISYIHTIQ